MSINLQGTQNLQSTFWLRKVL